MTATTHSVDVGRYSARQVISGLGVPEHDHITLSNYVSGNPGTVVFRNGGASGQTVCTLTLAYDGSGNLTSVTKA